MSIYKDIEKEDNDVVISDGDFSVVFCDEQNIEQILETNPSAYAQAPVLGYGADRLINGPLRLQQVRQDIKEQLQADNMRVKAVAVSADSIAVDAERIK